LLLPRRVPVVQAAAANERLRITDVEVHEITVPYEDWIAYELNHFYGPTRRTIYVVHTNSDLIGLGESNSPEPDAVLAKYIGSNPFDWVGDETSLGLGIAMYDLMGQAVGVPVYKLFGQKYRAVASKIHCRKRTSQVTPSCGRNAVCRSCTTTRH
jgi:L-alanine-DL-glutamate epimerase-like enolase superfamily enzyme